MGAVLKRKADEHQAATALKKTEEKLARKKKKGADESDSESSREASSTSSDEDFRQPPTRGGEELWRLSRKHPGRLLKRGMKELGRYLADRAGDGEGGRWEERRVMAYINQVMLSQGGSQGIGLRNQREAVTLGTCLDLLLMGDLASLGDTLMQRLKALESAVQDQGWQSARHLEIIPPQSASLCTVGERDQAAKQELRMLRLRGAMTKAKGSK